jgi:glutamate-1-semialdehyde aminotransferase
MGKSQELYKKAKKMIPGGTQLLSKRPEMFLPDQWPAYYSKAKGCQIWDLDGNKYTDMSYMGIGSCILGYSDEDVDTAVKTTIDKGTMTTLNAPEEYDLAKLLLNLHPWAGMVRYGRTGGEAMAIAVRIARAATNKQLVLFCGYHGWNDWYLAANLSSDESLNGHLLPGLPPKGVPKSLAGTAIPFTYNNIEEFENKFKTHKHELAAVIMEPVRNHLPENNFLKKIRMLTVAEKVPLIFDEITSGFRICEGGAHLHFHVDPDMAVFAKALSNGYPMATIIGNSKIMQSAQDTFISSTNWTERIGPVAAIATINKIKKRKVIKHINSIGKMVQNGWLTLAKKHKLRLVVSGIYPLGHFEFDYPNSQEIKTLMIQLMLSKGFLTTNAFYASYAHTETIVSDYLKALDLTFKELKNAINSDRVINKLRGPVAQTGFMRLT